MASYNRFPTLDFKESHTNPLPCSLNQDKPFHGVAMFSLSLPWVLKLTCRFPKTELAMRPSQYKYVLLSINYAGSQTLLNVLLQILDQFSEITKAKQLPASGKPGRGWSDKQAFCSPASLWTGHLTVCAGISRGEWWSSDFYFCFVQKENIPFSLKFLCPGL